jgi:hypothetical protein
VEGKAQTDPERKAETGLHERPPFARVSECKRAEGACPRFTVLDAASLLQKTAFPKRASAEDRFNGNIFE